MKKILIVQILIFVCLGLYAQETNELGNVLSQISEISDIQKLTSSAYKEKYVLKFSQQLDWKNAQNGNFLQRIVVCFRGFDRPTVLVTEGYSASYALRPNYREELSEMYNANLVVVEHRFFEESAPKNLDWKFMTVSNSASDLHHVREVFGKIFKNKWISTGISKGGSTCTYYRAFFPKDVDITVAYVAPISRNVEDGRHEKFLQKKVGTKEEREKIWDCQREFMKRKPQLMKLLDVYVKEQNYKFYLPLTEIFDYMVLEYEFSLWQWGTSIKTIPSKGESDKVWFDYLVEMVGPDYFAYPSEYLPFFYQAIRELGYYGYSLKNIKKFSSLKTTKDYVKKIMVSEDMRGVEFDKTVCKFTEKFLKQNDPTLIFIYGENDPWTASGVANWLNCKKKHNMEVFVQPRGSHLSRIANMPNNMKEQITSKLDNWLK